MIYLLLAILSSALVSIIMRLSEKHVSGNVGMLAVNYLMCITIAGIGSGFGNLFPQVEGFGFTLGLGLFNGLLYLAGFVLLQINVKRNGVVMSSTFMKLGVLVPMIVSIGFFGEKPEAVQILGFCLAILAIILINFEKEQTTMEFKAGLILLLLAGGGGDAMSKVFEVLGNPALSEQFLLYTFGSALILCVGLMAVKKEKMEKKAFFWGLLIGIPNFYSAKFLLKALSSVPAVITYPTYSIATIVVVSLTGVVFFKEKVGKRQKIAMGIIFVALALLNI